MIKKIKLFVLAICCTASMSVFAGKADKVKVCHFTGSSANPYVTIEVPQHTADKLVAKSRGDYIGSCDGGSCNVFHTDCSNNNVGDCCYDADGNEGTCEILGVSAYCFFDFNNY